MKDIQDHIRNRGALNLFDGKGVKLNTFTRCQFISPNEDGKVILPITVEGVATRQFTIGRGLFTVGATGGDAGSGTLNVGDVLVYRHSADPVPDDVFPTISNGRTTPMPKPKT